jgi:uncharacterized protein YndB with AHSA1/START domain
MAQRQLTVRTVVLIAAAPERVWQVLTDLVGFSRWHPNMEVLSRPDGPLVPGCVLRLRTNHGTALAVDFEVTLTEVTAPSLLGWQGGDPEVFFGRHRWTLTRDGEGTRVVNEERFSGAMAEGVLKEHRGTLEAQYAGADAALKEEAERVPV